MIDQNNEKESQKLEILAGGLSEMECGVIRGRT